MEPQCRTTAGFPIITSVTVTAASAGRCRVHRGRSLFVVRVLQSLGSHELSLHLMHPVNCNGRDQTETTSAFTRTECLTPSPGPARCPPLLPATTQPRSRQWSWAWEVGQARVWTGAKGKLNCYTSGPRKAHRLSAPALPHHTPWEKHLEAPGGLRSHTIWRLPQVSSRSDSFSLLSSLLRPRNLG